MPSEFRYRRRVEFADTDAAGMVHFTALLRYVEEAEHAFYRSFGASAFRREADRTVGLPRVALDCEYLGPVRYGEEVDVRLLVRRVGTRSVSYEAELSVARTGGEEEIARVTMTVAAAERAHDAEAWIGSALPDDLREGLEARND